MKKIFLFVIAVLLLCGFLVAFLQLASKLPKKKAQGNQKKILVLTDSAERARSEAERKGFLFYEAVKEGEREVVSQFLKEKVNVNIKDRNFGWTPLHWATAQGNLQLISDLLEQGAEVNARDNNRWTSLHEAVSNDREEIASLLLKNGAYVNAEDKNLWTPLHEAVANENLTMVSLLLEQGADVNKKDKNLWTPLELAKKEGNKNLTALLSKYNVAFKLKLLVLLFLLAVFGFLTLL